VSHSSAGYVPKLGQFRIISHPAVADQLLEAKRQGHQSRESWNLATHYGGQPLTRLHFFTAAFSRAEMETMVKIHVHQKQWDEALAAVAELKKHDSVDPRSEYLAAEAFLQYAGFPLHERGGLGVELKNHTLDLSKSGGAVKQKGALIAAVQPGSPAESSGLEVGDFVTKANEKPISNYFQLIRAIATRPGATLELELYRKRRLHRTTVRVGMLDATTDPPRFVPFNPAATGALGSSHGRRPID